MPSVLQYPHKFITKTSPAAVPIHSSSPDSHPPETYQCRCSKYVVGTAYRWARLAVFRLQAGERRRRGLREFSEKGTMNTEQMQKDLQVRNALLQTFHQHGMKPLPDALEPILAKLTELGVTANADAGYLSLTQGDTAVVPSAACERIRSLLPQLFVADPRRDKVSSREDLERGTPGEIAKAKSDWVKANGMQRWESLPRTKAQAEAKAIVPSAMLTAKEFRLLSRADKAALSGVLGYAGIERIMARRG